VVTAIRQEFSVSNFPYRLVANELVKFLVFANLVAGILAVLLCSADGHLGCAAPTEQCDSGMEEK